MASKQLKACGLKVTLPRVKILRILEESVVRHLSAEAIFSLLREVGEEVGLATVYRVLTQFEAAGLVIRHNFDGGNSVFELNDGEHHDHMVCVCCGLVTEFVDESIEARQREIAKQHQFSVSDHALVLYGACRACRSD